MRGSNHDSYRSRGMHGNEKRLSLDERKVDDNELRNVLIRFYVGSFFYSGFWTHLNWMEHFIFFSFLSFLFLSRVYASVCGLVCVCAHSLAHMLQDKTVHQDEIHVLNIRCFG